MMRRINIALLLCGLAGLAWMTRTIGFDEAWHNLTALGWGLPVLVAMEGVGDVLHTFGWRQVGGPVLRSIPLPRLLAIRLAGYAVNYLTPTAAVGGEVVRASLTAVPGRTADAAGVVLIDKACMAMTHLLLVIAGAALLLSRVHLPHGLKIAMMVAGSLMTVSVVLFLFLQTRGRFGALAVWVAQRCFGEERTRDLVAATAAVDQALRRFYNERHMDFFLAVAWHLAGFTMGLAQTWFFFHLAGRHPPAVALAGIWMAGLWFDLLTFAVPMHLGTLEGSRVLAFTALGYTSVGGLTFGLALRVGQVLWAIVGLIGYSLLTLRLPRTTFGTEERAVDS